MRKIPVDASSILSELAMAINENVRRTQKLEAGYCSVCGSEGIAFMCIKCGRVFCPTHAYDSFGCCPECIDCVPFRHNWH